jgi:hypothetical protein
VLQSKGQDAVGALTDIFGVERDNRKPHVAAKKAPVHGHGIIKRSGDRAADRWEKGD